MLRGEEGRERRRPKPSLRRSLKTKLEEISALWKVSRTITSSMGLERMLNLISRQICRVMHCRACAIYILDTKDLILQTHSNRRRPYRSTRDLRRRIETECNFSAAVCKNRKPCLIRDLGSSADKAFSGLSKKFAFGSLLVVPLIEKDDILGTLAVFRGKSQSAFDKDDLEELKLFASQAAVAIDNARLFKRAKEGYLNTMKLLASVIDAKDAYTHDHSQNVAALALGIADRIGLDERAKENIKYASFIHDIGKINIEASILRKDSPLTEDEWDQIREHPTTAAEIISKADFLHELVPIILYHHVRYAGGGYPNTGIKEDEIPLGARVLAVADAYEAMTSDRPYRPRMRKDEALRELVRCSGTQFDPKIVDAFARSMANRDKGRYGLRKV